MLGPAPPQPAEDYDAFAHQPPFRPRRNPAKLWTALALAAGLLLVAATAALYIWGVPTIGQGLTRGGTPLKLSFNAENQRLASGNALLTVNGQILNPTGEVQRVPQIMGELRDASGRKLYDWSIAPPVTELQPGQSANFSAAEAGIPTGARQVRLRFGPTA